MKKIYLLIATLFVSCMLCAQTSSTEHFTFKGVPIDGSISEFVSRLQEVGYTPSNFDEKSAELTGAFGGEYDCKIAVFATPKSHKVYNLLVIMSTSSSWNSLKSDYKEYKSMLTTKYGKPKTSVERFKDPYYEGDGYEIQAFRLNKGLYVSWFETESGVVTLAISYLEGGARIVMIYTDNINNNLNDAEVNTMKYGDL